MLRSLLHGTSLQKLRENVHHILNFCRTQEQWNLCDSNIQLIQKVLMWLSCEIMTGHACHCYIL